MRKRIISFLLSFSLLIFLFSGNLLVFAASETPINRFNVVFVTDASGSIGGTDATDPDGYRYEAVDLFLGLLANGGNYVGSVVFSSDVVLQQSLVEVSGKTEKESISQSIRSQEVGGWTDIGGALLTAVDLLQNGGDTSLPSIIILLTDGNTEMGASEETQQSISDKETALELCRQAGIQIYSTCLNENQTANVDELRQISQATGGEFTEVTNAADLQMVFDSYYSTIYSTDSVEMMDETIPESGNISRQFDVADVGVEEVNVVVFGEATQYTLTQPDGQTYSAEQLNKCLYSANTFDLLKIEDPAPGLWTLEVTGNAGSSIRIFKIYNSNLNVQASIENPEDSYVIGTPVNFMAQLYEGDTIVTDMNRYKEYTATLTVTDYNGNILFQQTEETPAGDGYHFSYTPESYDTVYAVITVNSSEISAESEKCTLNVGNTSPVAAGDSIDRTIWIWPFLIPTNSTIDLSEAATDNEDDALNYTIVSSTWMEDDYTLDGSMLTINSFSVSKGSFTVEAYDSQGAYCTFEVKVNTVNIGLLTMIFLIIAIIVVVGIIVVFSYIAANKKFMGEIVVTNLANGLSDRKRWGRGSKKLSAFQIGNSGLRPDCKLQASGKDYIIFQSKKPVYSDNAKGAVKKMQIRDRMNVKISNDSQVQIGTPTQGIIIRFESDLNRRSFF